MIEIMGPPAVGKTTFAAVLARDFVAEQLPLLRRAGQLPPPALERQQVLLNAVAAEGSRRRPYSRVVFDAGPVSTLAFTRYAFGPEVARASLRTTVREYGDDWFALEYIVWLDAPLPVRLARAEADPSRRRRNFAANLESFRTISSCVAELMAILPANRGLRVRTDDPDGTKRTHELLREQHLPLMSPGMTIDLIERWLTR